MSGLIFVYIFKYIKITQVEIYTTSYEVKEKKKLYDVTIYRAQRNSSRPYKV